MYKKITISVLLIQLLSQITIEAMHKSLISPYEHLEAFTDTFSS